MRVLLHEMAGNEIGWMAWCLDAHGFATWASSEAEVLGRVPTKLAEYQSWLVEHGLACPDVGGDVRVVERVRGNEILFSWDYGPCAADEIDHTLRLLSASRSDLVKTIEALPEAALDWDPPYQAFAEWATWRSIRAILAHMANCETHYYLSTVGHESGLPPAPPDGDWATFLAAHREEAVAFLRQLAASPDRARVCFGDDGAWSVRKVLRRLVWHERLHWKSIRRIGRAFECCTRPGELAGHRLRETDAQHPPCALGVELS
jgi:hypothetical protein